MKVLGIDICSSSIVCCVLNELPEDVQTYYLENEPIILESGWDAIKAIAEIDPDVAVYEPTGECYSRQWVERLGELGIETKGVDHKRLRSYRIGLGLPDKDDFADAIAMACYALDPLKSKARFAFLKHRSPEIREIRALVLRLQHLDRIKNPIGNRLKQDLAIAMPEHQNKTIDDAPLFWGWLAGLRKSARYDRDLDNTVGLGLLPETRIEAGLLTQILKEEQRITAKLGPLVNQPQFSAYNRVFSRYGFGLKIGALLLSQIYPIQDFLGPDGKPEIIRRKGKNSGKQTTRYLSERRFLKCLGLAPVREYSGKSKKSKKGGSELCRKALWQWCHTRVEPRTRWGKEKNMIIRQWQILYGQALENFSTKAELIAAQETEKKLRPGGIKVKMARAWLRRRVGLALFHDLVDSVSQESTKGME
ncbi:transposase [Candidatus Synechococcus calcipolaris G9]|uniref:Transposase n=1 Tax=Candidatus Synechococcus calcipolaris G9 TaxID=1497997 RepID=A0ABT6F2F3_9SYNE|nr:transposase [Candidatus Synechococcus calcipolaris]MDG2992024.1 transposase [Candidatus Synechococcus calcipolaris G9]